MKRLFLLSFALIGAKSAFAQIITVPVITTNTTTEKRIIEIDDSKYNRVSVAFGAFHYDLSRAYNELYEDFGEGGAYLSLMAEYIHGWRLMKSKPLFFESGLACQLNADGISLAIPLDVTYRLMNQKGYYFAPFAGLNANLQVFRPEDEYYYKKVYYGPGKYDYHQEKIYPSAKFFQLGYNIGANFGRKHWNIGIGYRGGFTPDYSSEEDGNVKTGFVYLGIGYNF